MSSDKSKPARNGYERQGPLANVRVIDLTSTLMGPMCTQILADLGCDVIKVESEDGDTTRFIPPALEPAYGAMFANLNRGKRSIVLNLKVEHDKAALLRLIETADVFVHSMRPNAIDRLGLNYSAVAGVNPRIIYAGMTGFGDEGPYAELPAYDDVIQAASGMAILQGELQGGEPSYLATMVADKVTGLTGVYAIIAALFSRERDGVGQEVSVNMFETMSAFVMTEHLGGALIEPPIGPPTYRRAVSSTRRPYKTADGYIAILIYTDQHWARFFEALGNPPWSQEAKYSSFTSRMEHVDQVYAQLHEVLGRRSSADWLSLFRRVEIPAMPLLSTADLLDDDHLRSTGFWREQYHGQTKFRFPGIPSRFSKTPGAISGPAPRFGEDTAEVLMELGPPRGDFELHENP